MFLFCLNVFIEKLNDFEYVGQKKSKVRFHILDSLSM